MKSITSLKTLYLLGLLSSGLLLSACAVNIPSIAEDGTTYRRVGNKNVLSYNSTGEPVNGLYEIYWENGQLYQSAYYINGVLRDGLVETYEGGGALLDRTHYKNGLKDGLSQNFEHGQLFSSSTWRQGLLWDEAANQPFSGTHQYYRPVTVNGEAWGTYLGIGELVRTSYKDGVEHGIRQMFVPKTLCPGIGRCVVANSDRFKPELRHTYLYKDGELLEEICEEALREVSIVRSDIITNVVEGAARNTTTSITTEYRECMSDALMRAGIEVSAPTPADQTVQRSQQATAESLEELERQAVEARKNNCTSFGFTPDSDAHAECVMQLFIAEQAEENSATER